MLNIPALTLNDGAAFPLLGLGTYELRGEQGINAVAAAIDSGYRLLDSAVDYENEREVGEAVRRSSVDPAEITVVTKIPGSHHGYDKAIESTNGSLAALGTDRIDLSLIHWPNPRIDKFVETWQAMIDLREAGRIRSIGVANFTEAMLTRLIDKTGVVPVVNQVELHPYFPQQALRDFHDHHNIRTMSWSPLATRAELFNEKPVRELTQRHNVTPSQVVLRWHIEIGSTPIPKSSDPDRQRENADVFGFELSPEEVRAISALERGRLQGDDGDPEKVEF